MYAYTGIYYKAIIMHQNKSYIMYLNSTLAQTCVSCIDSIGRPVTRDNFSRDLYYCITIVSVGDERTDWFHIWLCFGNFVHSADLD